MNLSLFSKKILLSVVLGLSLFLGTNTTSASSLVTYQGTLKNPTGISVPDSSYTFTFNLYTQPTGGSTLWTETQTLSTSQGNFSVLLGSVTPFPNNIFLNNPNLYLGITVNSDSEMSPRQRVGSSPYAFTADAVSLSNLKAAAATNSVDNANFSQAWNWSTLSSGSAISLGINNTATADTTVLDITSASTGDNAYILRVNDDGTYTDSTPLVVDKDGKVGIGTISPNAKLQVNGNITATTLVVTDAMTTRSNLGLSYAATTEVSGATTIVTWGDSLTAGSGGNGTTYPGILLKLYGDAYTVVNKGVSSNRSTHIAVRQGAIASPMTIVGGQIPISGGVAVTFATGYEPVTSHGPAGGVYGTAAGVYGLVTYNAGTYTFTRSIAGTTVSVSGATEFQADIGTLNNGYTIIWSGRNNFDNPTQVKADIAAMVASLGHTRYLILSVLNGSGESVGGTTYNNIIQLNQDLAAIYGSRYLDIRAHLVSQYNPLLPQDVIDYNNDIVPSSLRTDFVHLNAAGYTKVAERIYGFVNEQNTSAVKTILTKDNVADILALGLQATGTTKNLQFSNTTNSSQNGVIWKNGNRFMHDFNYGNNGAVITTGNNLFIGLAAGNFTMGSTATQAFEASNNVAVGQESMYNNTTGAGNTALGNLSLRANTTGYNNSGLGDSALYANTTGYFNVAVGRAALINNTTGYQNTAIGVSAGRNLADGTSLNTLGRNSVFIGYGTRAAADNQPNQIVIGADAIGGGSNSVVLGNDNITKTLLKGKVSIGNTNNTYSLDVGSISVSGIVSRFQNSTGTCDINPTTTALSCSSDEDLKENILSLNETSLDKIKQLNPVTYSWKNDQEHISQTGFIAQQVRTIFPHLVTEDKDTHLLSLNYMGFIPYVIKSIQELVVKIDGFAESFVTKNFFAKKATIDELCIKDTCLTEHQLIRVMKLLDKEVVQDIIQASEVEPTFLPIEDNTYHEIEEEIKISSQEFIEPVIQSNEISN